MPGLILLRSTENRFADRSLTETSWLFHPRTNPARITGNPKVASEKL